MGQLREKSYVFAIRITKLVQYLQGTKKEFVLSKQILRSGTAIGALIRESEFGESPADFRHKMRIALKEANETDYWISLLKDTQYINKKMHLSLQSDCKQLLAMLISSINTSKKNNKGKS